jgi:hypothetical protein
MKYYTIINLTNSESLDINNNNQNKFIFWLNEKCVKWILKDNEDIIECIFETDLYLKTSNVTTAIFNHCFKNKKIKNKIKNKIENKIENNKYRVTTNIIKHNIDFESYLKKINLNNNQLEIHGFLKTDILGLLYENLNTENLNTENENNENENNVNNCNNDDNMCKYCFQPFRKKYNLNRHQENFCKSKINILISENEKLINENRLLKKELKKNKNVVNNINTQNNTTNVTNNITNITNNIQQNLNFYLSNTLDIDTFIENFKNDPKYQLKIDETQKLYDLAIENGIISYGNNLLYYIRNKYKLQLKDLNDIDVETTDCVLPFVTNDTNLRSHYEKTPDGWKLLSSDEKIKNIVIISKDQIYNHHNKIYYLTPRDKKIATNCLLRNSDYKNLELEKISKKMKS